VPNHTVRVPRSSYRTSRYPTAVMGSPRWARSTFSTAVSDGGGSHSKVPNGLSPLALDGQRQAVVHACHPLQHACATPDERSTGRAQHAAATPTRSPRRIHAAVFESASTHSVDSQGRVGDALMPTSSTCAPPTALPLRRAEHRTRCRISCRGVVGRALNLTKSAHLTAPFWRARPVSAAPPQETPSRSAACSGRPRSRPP
jgi:hypothetical protein